MNYREIGILIIGIIIALFGFIMIIGSTVGILEGQSKFLVSDIVFSSLMGVLPLLIGVWISIFINRKAKLRKLRHFENRLLQVIKNKGGTFTVADIAMEMNITLDEAQKIVDDLYERELIRANLPRDPGGVVTFKFQEFMRSERINTEA